MPLKKPDFSKFLKYGYFSKGMTDHMKTCKGQEHIAFSLFLQPKKIILFVDTFCAKLHLIIILRLY